MHLDAIERMLPDHVGELARVFPALFSVPGLSARAQQAVVPNDGKELRRRAWAALSELFASLGRNRPLVLSIDDLQWADVDSVLLLDALLRDTAEARLLVIASYRPEEASRNELLVQHLDASRSIDRGRGFIDVPVAGLPAREAEALARATMRTCKRSCARRAAFLSSSRSSGGMRRRTKAR
jgi:hypothetical protein